MFHLHLSFLLLTRQKTTHKYYIDLELVLCTYKIYVIYVVYHNSDLIYICCI